MTATILWTPQNIRYSKNRQGGKSFSNCVYENSTEKKLIYLNMKLVCAISHLNFLASCFKKNLCPKYLNVISEHFNFGFANDDIKESLSQLD